MKIRVKDTSAQFIAQQSRASRAIKLSVAVALTRTAVKIKTAEVDMMQRKLDRPSPHTLKSLIVKAATKDRPEATVQTKDVDGTSAIPASSWLYHLVNGGSRPLKASEKQIVTQGTPSYWVPGEFADLDQYGNIKGSVMSKILSQLRLRRDNTQNASNSRRSKAKRKREAFFLRGNIVFLRVTEGIGKSRESQIKPYLFLINAPHYKPILPFFDVAQEVMDQNIATEFSKAFDEFAS